MTFERRILHHGPTPSGTPVILSLQALKKCWFELNRQGGCGAAELILSNEFFDRDQVDVGDWISFEYQVSERWYLGRVEERVAESPAQTRLRLEGMSIELNEVFPGGFGEEADGKKPHRFAGTDLFQHDPDYDQETFDSIADAVELVNLLIQNYVTSQTHISYISSRIETPDQSAVTTSMKFRGEESVRSILKELSIRAQSASWGVDEQGEFFFLRRRDTSLAEFREGLDLTSLSEIRDREHLFNRLLLTGDYIYDDRDQSDEIARRSFRWRGNFVEPISQGAHGDRRLRIWLPWVRTQQDSLSFAKEFFRSYSQPQSRFLIETTNVSQLHKPWEGRYALFDQSGTLLTFSHAETVRIVFDHAPKMRMELGPIDPRELWAEPPHDERWELPDQTLSAGGNVPLPPSIPIGDPPPPPPPPPVPSEYSWSSLDTSSFHSSALYSSGLTSSNLTSSAWSSEDSESDSESEEDSGSETGTEPSMTNSSGSLNSLSSEQESSGLASSDVSSHESSGGGSEEISSSNSEFESEQSEQESSQQSFGSSEQSEGSQSELESSVENSSFLSGSGSGNETSLNQTSEFESSQQVESSDQEVSSMGEGSSMSGQSEVESSESISSQGNSTAPPLTESSFAESDESLWDPTMSNPDGSMNESLESWWESEEPPLSSEPEVLESTLDISPESSIE